MRVKDCFQFTVILVSVEPNVLKCLSAETPEAAERVGEEPTRRPFQHGDGGRSDQVSIEGGAAVPPSVQVATSESDVTLAGHDGQDQTLEIVDVVLAITVHGDEIAVFHRGGAR
jgi:hypothetical protein